MRNKLNTIMTGLPEGMPVTSARLASAGVYPSLAARYVKSGWLKPLARGIYQRVGDALELYPTLRLLEAMAPGLHVGGKSALDWYGIRHYVYQRPILLLYGWNAFRLPAWFTERFPARYRRKRLFDETPEAMLGVTPYHDRADGPMVAGPERALLELLSEVGVHQPLEEARQLTESTYTLRHDEVTRLLVACRSVKTVRLALSLGREFGLPWVEKLDPTKLRVGSASRWVARSKEGLLVLRP
jgi:hypothetical protein